VIQLREEVAPRKQQALGRTLTSADWNIIRKYAYRVRDLSFVKLSISPDTVSRLVLAPEDMLPLFPNLKVA